MWQSVLDFVELIEREENELEELLELNEHNRSILDENLDDEMEIKFYDEEEANTLNKTFTKMEFDNNNDPYINNSMLFNSFSQEIEFDNNFSLLESYDLTPIPKPPSKKKHKPSSQLFQTLPTIHEFSIYN